MPTGTLVVPSPSDVRLGVQYGADGTEYTGTLHVATFPTQPSTDLLGSLIAIVRQLPDSQTVQFKNRTSGDTYDTTASPFAARRQPRDNSDFDHRDMNTARWQLYALTSPTSQVHQTTKPVRLGKFTDAQSNVWHVQRLSRRWNDPTYGDLIFDCECVLAVS